MPETSPPLTELEKEIFTEDTFETVLERETMPQVSAALSVGWPLSYANHNPQDVAEIGRGGESKKRNSGRRRSILRGLGWHQKMSGNKLRLQESLPRRHQTRLKMEYFQGWPKATRLPITLQPGPNLLWSPMGYSSRLCYNTRRTRRDQSFERNDRTRPRSFKGVRTQTQREQLAHSRTFSAETVSSGLQAMSLDTGSSFSDDANPNIEYGPLQFKSIPWSAEGIGKMTIKLALWWLHIETGKDLTVQGYPPPSRTSDHGQLQQVPGKTRAPVPPSGPGTSGLKGKGKGPAKR